MLAFVINKFTKRFRKPKGYIDNNELVDFLSRLPSDPELVCVWFSFEISIKCIISFSYNIESWRSYRDYHRRRNPNVQRLMTKKCDRTTFHDQIIVSFFVNKRDKNWFRLLVAIGDMYRCFWKYKANKLRPKRCRAVMSIGGHSRKFVQFEGEGRETISDGDRANFVFWCLIFFTLITGLVGGHANRCPIGTASIEWNLGSRGRQMTIRFSHICFY